MDVDYSILVGEDTEDQNSGKIFVLLHTSDVTRRYLANLNTSDLSPFISSFFFGIKLM